MKITQIIKAAIFFSSFFFVSMSYAASIDSSGTLYPSEIQTRTVKINFPFNTTSPTKSLQKPYFGDIQPCPLEPSCSNIAGKFTKTSATYQTTTVQSCDPEMRFCTISQGTPSPDRLNLDINDARNTYCPDTCRANRSMDIDYSTTPPKITNVRQATCPPGYAQIGQYLSDEEVKKNLTSTSMPFPIPDYATYQSYVAKGYTCEDAAFTTLSSNKYGGLPGIFTTTITPPIANEYTLQSFNGVCLMGSGSAVLNTLTINLTPPISNPIPGATPANLVLLKYPVPGVGSFRSISGTWNLVPYYWKKNVMTTNPVCQTAIKASDATLVCDPATFSCQLNNSAPCADPKTCPFMAIGYLGWGVRLKNPGYLSVTYSYKRCSVPAGTYYFTKRYVSTGVICSRIIPTFKKQ